LTRLGFGLAVLKPILKNDNRRAPRRLCDTGAWIRPEGTFKIYGCRVSDISKLGVRLTLADVRSIPDRFIFFLADDDVGREARVKWRRGTQIGAEF